jgi:hypothetical protein
VFVAAQDPQHVQLERVEPSCKHTLHINYTVKKKIVLDACFKTPFQDVAFGVALFRTLAKTSSKRRLGHLFI